MEQLTIKELAALNRLVKKQKTRHLLDIHKSEYFATNELKEYDNNGFGNGNTIKRVCHVYGNRTVTMIWPSNPAKCHISIA